MLRLTQALIDAVKATGVPLTLAQAKRQGRPTVEARPAETAVGRADQAA
jgi:hypothetical protein